MTADRLIQHFHEIADAPDAVARLRRFVLDLAVRGKLVEQNPEDEASIVLLDRIAHLRAGESQRRKSSIKEVGLLSPGVATEIPSSWAWSCLAEIGLINPRVEAPDDEAASFVPMPLIFAEYRKPPLHQVRTWAEIKKGFTQFAEGDVGLAKITPCFENGKSTVFRNLTGGVGAGTTELHIVRPILVDSDYVLLFLKSPSFLDGGIPSMTGTAGQKRVPRDYFARSPFPLPPLAEQHRIVAKVDELMALCDELEAAQTKRERRRDRLVAATLHHLSNGNTVTAAGQADSISAKRWPEFQQSAQQASTEHPKNAISSEFSPAPASSPDENRAAHFFVNHLPRLTTKPNHIKQLRQTILDLAVRGKLVEQDPNDEPPNSLVEQLNDERNRRIAAGTLKPARILSDEAADAPALAPVGWQQYLIDQIALKVTDGEHATPIRASAGRYLLSARNVTNEGIDLSDVDFVPEEEYVRIRRRCDPERGDILISCSGSVGRVAIVDCDDKYVMVRSAALVKLLEKCTLPEYIAYALRSSSAQSQIESLSRSTAQANLFIGAIRKIRIPLPPLAEQHRIVAKVNALMSLCDELETSITTATTTRTALLESTLQAALHAGESR